MTELAHHNMGQSDRGLCVFMHLAHGQALITGVSVDLAHSPGIHGQLPSLALPIGIHVQQIFHTIVGHSLLFFFF